MTLSEHIINYIYNYTIGIRKDRFLLTLLGGVIFLSVTGLFVLIPIYIGYKLNIPELWGPPLNSIISGIFFITGIILIIWTNIIFIVNRGTPVPVNPPPKLITQGPFSYSRNPMTTGLYIIMFGFGIYYSSLLSVFIFTPLYIYLHTLEFKFIEEPELEKRLGKEYLEYKKRTPMYFTLKHFKNNESA